MSFGTEGACDGSLRRALEKMVAWDASGVSKFWEEEKRGGSAIINSLWEE